MLIDHLNDPVDPAFDAAGRLVVVEPGSLDSFLGESRVLRFTLP